jgi:RNA polymerase sigma-B factor
VSGPVLSPPPRLKVPTQSLTRDRDEGALFDRLRDGDPIARAALVERFLPLSRMLARRYRAGDETDDLEQVAAIGLLKAIDRFEPERGLAFSTFAFPTIVGELKRHFRDRCWSVRVPRSMQELAARVEHVSHDLHGKLGRAPTVAELADGADTNVEQVLEALQVGGARWASSLDEPRREGEEDDALGREVAVEEPGFAAVDDSVIVDDLLRRLDPRDRLIVELRFREDLIQSQIGARLGISQMQVSRIIRRAIDQLRLAAGEPRSSS